MTINRIHRVAALGASVALAIPLGLAAASPASAAVSPGVAVMLQEMVAEEKLAHDVYTTLGDLYSVRTFDSIANSEARHQDAVRTLMSVHGVIDNTVGDAVGEFDDARVQKLYDDLVKQGSASLAAAASVGITIERMDIADLDEAMADNPPADVLRVLENLRSGSENHLAAFTNLAEGGSATGAGPQKGQQGAGHGNKSAGVAGQGRQAAGRGMTSAPDAGARDGSCR